MSDSPTTDTKREISIDMNNLYREETYTDLRIGSVRRLIPVKPDGSQDYTRKPVFIGFAQLMTQQGSLPIQCPIEAKSLKQAWGKFPDVMTQAVDKIIAEAKEIERKESSRLIVPGSEPSGTIIKP